MEALDLLGARPPPTPPHPSSYQRWGADGPRRGRPPPSGLYRPRPRALSLLGGATLAGGTVVYFSSLETVPYTQRRHAILISTSMERALGEATFAQIKESAAGKLLPRNHPAVRAVERVGRRLAAVASDGAGGGEVDHMKGLEWEFIVVDEVRGEERKRGRGKGVCLLFGLFDRSHTPLSSPSPSPTTSTP